MLDGIFVKIIEGLKGCEFNNRPLYPYDDLCGSLHRRDNERYNIFRS